MWKVQVREKEEIRPQQLVAILEAMKLEINVNAPESMKPGKAVVEKLLIEPGETVKVGLVIPYRITTELTINRLGVA